MDLGSAWSHLGHLNLVEFCRESARWSGSEGAIHETDGYVCFATKGGFPGMFNGVLRTDDRVPAKRVVDAAEEWFRARGHGYTLWVRDTEADKDLAAAASDAGLQNFAEDPEMVCAAPVEMPRPARGIELRWVENDDGVRDFISVNSAAYESLGLPGHVMGEAISDVERFRAPNMHSVVAYENDKPMAAAQTLLSHGIAGVYWVGTVADARGRGLGQLVTSAVTNRGFEAGAPVNTLQASPMGAPIYLRMGYETIYRYWNYIRFGF